jgi:hypothetical protein
MEPINAHENTPESIRDQLDTAILAVIKDNPNRKCAWIIADASVIDLAEKDMRFNNENKPLRQQRGGSAGLARVFDRAAARLKARGLIWSTNQKWSAR